MSKKSKSTIQHSQDSETEEVLKGLFDKPLHRFSSYDHTSLVLAFVISVVVGLFTGLVGVGLVLSGSLSHVPFFSSFTLESVLPERQVIIREQQAVTVTQEEQLQTVLTKLKPSLISVVIHDEDTETVSDALSSNELQSLVYTSSDVVGYGFVLTSDGWLVISRDAFLSHSADMLRVVTVSGDVYTIDQVIEDSVGGVMYIKIAAQDLIAASFDGQFDPETGSGIFRLFVSFPSEQIVVQPDRVIAYEETSVVRQSDDLERRVLVTNVGNNTTRAVAANYAGDVVGFIDGNRLRPALHFASTVAQVLNSGVVSRPFLGLEWIDLRGNAGLPDSVSRGHHKGASVVSVKPGSAAEGAGFMTGDIIQLVNDIEVNGGATLSEIVQQFAPGDILIFMVLRDDTSIELVAELSER